MLVCYIFPSYLLPLLTLQSLPRVPNMSPFQHCVFFLIYKITHGMQLVLSYANGCAPPPILCSMGNLLEATSSEQWPSLSQQPAAAGSSLVRSGPHQPLSIHAGICLVCLGLLKGATPAVSTIAVSCPEDSISGLFSPSSNSCILSTHCVLWFPEPWGGGAIKVSHLRLNTHS